MFFSNPYFLVASVVTQVIGLYWCWVNFWKMKEIKNYLVPALVRDDVDGRAVQLPARYKYADVRKSLNTSPGPLSFIEKLFGGKKATNHQEELFGAAGKNGKELYRSSIKFHTWLCVSQVVFYLMRLCYVIYLL